MLKCPKCYQESLDAANVAAEDVNGNITSYIRGINLVASISGNETYYYTFNAHGDVVGLMNESNQLAKSYDYDAFGVEKNPSDEDSNPFRYCGEYYDVETGTYYLRARYYDPRIGRFTSEDTHWNTSNKIYGDNPQKINEREDALGLKTYSYAPQISAVVQIGNLYVYAVGNPVMYVDEDGEMAKLVKAAIHGLIDGVIAAMTSDAENTTDYVIDIATAFGSGFVSDFNNPILSLIISLGGETLKYVINDELTFDSFNTILFDTVASWLLDMKIGEMTESIFSIFSFYSSDDALNLVGIDDDFLNLILTVWTEISNSIIGKEVGDESKRG